MIVGLGIDVVQVARVARMLNVHGARFLRRCFREGEARRPEDPEHLAGLLAAKEAAFKALGTGWGEGVGWLHVGIGRTGSGAPELELEGPARVRAAALGARRSLVSITHAGGVAVAVVVMES